jgi:putative flippase GtrA
MLNALPLAKIIRFIAVGGSVTLVHIGLGFLLVRLMPQHSLVAALLAYLGAAAISYISQRTVTFRSTTPHHRSVPRFVAMLCVGIVVSLSSALVLTDWLGFHPMIAILCASGSMALLSFVSMDRMIFPDQR